MEQLNASGEMRTPLEEWQSPDDPETRASLYHVKTPGKPDRFEGDLYRAGQLVDTVMGTTREMVVERLQASG